MSLTPLLEVAISLALLYLFFSQVVSSAMELLASWTNLRGKYLREWLNLALNDPNTKNWAELVYLHPTVDTLAQTESRPPTYIPDKLFATALVDLVLDEARPHRFVPVLDANGHPLPEVVYQEGSVPGATPLEQLKNAVGTLAEGDFKALLRGLLRDAESSVPNAESAAVLARFQQNLCDWYNAYMDRVNGWYKRRVRGYLFLIGLVLALVCNIDSLYVARYLWQHADARRQLADYATTYVQQPGVAPKVPVIDSTQVQRAKGMPVDSVLAQADSLRAHTQQLVSTTQGLGFPIGWTISSAPDSTQLPGVFYEAHPAKQLDKPAGAVVAAYWVQYQRLTDTLKTKNHLIPQLNTRWKRDTVLALPVTRVPVRPAQLALVTGPTKPDWLTMLGWLITAVALSFGAPFWFDLLCRFVNIRNLGSKPAKTKAK